MTTMARPSKKPTELRRRDFPALLRRRTYSDGKPRPLLRGVLHGCVSAGLALAAQGRHIDARHLVPLSARLRSRSVASLMAGVRAADRVRVRLNSRGYRF